jgi:cytochrome c-type biogenesis protein CcmE
MKQKAVRIGITSLVLILALGGLMYSTLSEGTEYYKHVEEVMGDPGAWHGKNLQLHGYVVKDSIMRKRDSLEYRFKVQSKGAIVDATYTGIVPDTFKDDSEVVLKGRLDANGFHVAPNGVMAKCPSKYEAKKGLTGPGA